MHRITLSHAAARQRCHQLIDAAIDGSVVKIYPADPRNLDQNAAMWAMLADISSQLEWHGIKLSSEEWKDLLSAGLVKTKVVPNIDGTGFVILGQRTSNMSKREFSDLLELIAAFGSERGVRWSDTSPRSE